MSRMLQIVVIPTNCFTLKNFGDDCFGIFAEDWCTLYHLSGILVCFAQFLQDFGIKTNN